MPINLRAATEIEREVSAFAQSGNGGLILSPGPESWGQLTFQEGLRDPPAAIKSDSLRTWVMRAHCGAESPAISIGN